MKRVLLVDNEEDFLWMLQRNLSKALPQIDFFAVTSGGEALQSLQQESTQLVISNLKMPGMSGIDLLLEIKNSYKDTRVIIMTEHPSRSDENEAMLNGALRTLAKTTPIAELEKIILSIVNQEEHFQGTIDGIELIDIVQFNGLSAATAALKVNTTDEEGIIFFKDGNVVHAMCEEKIGEDAFFAILRFEGGTLQNIRGAEAPVLTIQQDLQSLLLQATVSGDEEEDTKHLKAATQIEPITSPHQQLITEESSMNSNTIQEILAEFTAIDGVHTACLVGRDGFLLDSIARAGIDAEMIGAIASSGFGSAESMGNQLGQGELTMTMLEYENGPVMFAPVGSEAFLVIVADQDTNLGWIRISIKKNSKRIEEAASL